jgi:hypothetical protein
MVHIPDDAGSGQAENAAPQKGVARLFRFAQSSDSVLVCSVNREAISQWPRGGKQNAGN